MKKMKKGFSLLELIVVLTVIGIIGTFSYNKFTEVMMEAKSEQLGTQLNKIEVALNKYYSELGTYPLDVNWLLVDKIDNTATKVDALSLKLAGGAEDPDVIQYWSGPYITDMKLVTKAGDFKTIKAVFGDEIVMCGKVELNSDKSIVNLCDADVSTPENFINVMLIKGVDSEAVKFLFKQINGREMNEDDKTKGNAYAVATGTGDHKSDKLGVPAKEAYGDATPFVIYRYADNIQN